MREDTKTVVKGIIAGAAAGLIASWVMTEFQEAVTKVTSDEKKEGGEDATVKTAKAISTNVFGHQLTQKEKKVAGPAVHYVYGSGLGALYGGLSARYPAMSSGFGTNYATAAFAFGDEIAIPALGLGKKPTDTPWPKHAEAMASHLVYGLTLEGFRRLFLKVL